MNGNWVTINGAHVFIQGGIITKGPVKLIGKSVDEDSNIVRNTDTRKKQRTAKELESSYGGERYRELNEKQRLMIRRRVDSGMSVDEAFQQGFEKVGRGKNRGKARSKEELEELYGSRYSTMDATDRRHFREYIKSGNTVEQAYAKIDVKHATGKNLKELKNAEAIEKYGDGWNNLTLTQKHIATDLSRGGKRGDRVDYKPYDPSDAVKLATGDKSVSRTSKGTSKTSKGDSKYGKGLLEGLTRNEARRVYYNINEKGMSPQEARRAVLQKSYDKLFQKIVGGATNDRKL